MVNVIGVFVLFFCVNNGDIRNEGISICEERIHECIENQLWDYADRAINDYHELWELDAFNECIKGKSK